MGRDPRPILYAGEAALPRPMNLEEGGSTRQAPIGPLKTQM